MSEADIARENAISFEVKKDALQQRQNGDWMLRLVAQAIDLKPVNVSDVLVNAKMGTRFLCTLVELNDDETAVDHKAMERDKWKDLGPTTQAAMRCNEPMFWAWLREVHGYNVTSTADAAIVVRELCGVASRADLSKPGHTASRVLWHQFDHEFQAWKAREHG